MWCFALLPKCERLVFMNMKIIVLMLSACVVSSQELPKNSAMGRGTHYSTYQPKIEEGDEIVSELEKNDTLYSYIKASESKYFLRFEDAGEIKDVAFLDAIAMRDSHLVDLSFDGSFLCVLLTQSQGYYHYIFERNDNVWTPVSWVYILDYSIFGADGNAHLVKDIKSASLAEGFQVKVEHDNFTDLYTIDYEMKEVSHQGNERHSATIKYMK